MAEPDIGRGEADDGCLAAEFLAVGQGLELAQGAGAGFAAGF